VEPLHYPQCNGLIAEGFLLLSLHLRLSPSFLICSMVQFGNILLISFTHILPHPSFMSGSLAQHPVLVLWPSLFTLHLSFLSFGSSLHLLLSFFLIIFLSLGCSYIHHHIFSFSAQLSFIPSAISKRISQKLSRTSLAHISPQNPEAINGTLLTSARLGH